MEKRSVCYLNQNYSVTLRDDIDALVFEEIFKHRVYRIIDEYLATLTKPVIDVGAHAGFFTLYCRHFNNRVPIIALEPEPHNFEALEHTCREQQLVGVKCVKAALGPINGEETLVLDVDSHNHHLNRGLAPKNKKTTVVDSCSLNSLCEFEKIKLVGLLKLDIEGGEYDIFEAMTKNDYNMVAAILLEYHRFGSNNEKIIESKLRENGFSVQMFPSKFDKTMGFLWAINKRLKT